jgi:hypothetical protein
MPQSRIYIATKYGGRDPDGVFFRGLRKLAVLKAAATPCATKHGGRDQDGVFLRAI